jgi:hypothetical protein
MDVLKKQNMLRQCAFRSAIAVAIQDHEAKPGHGCSG